MRRYLVECVHSRSGETRLEEVEAASAADASALVQGRGMTVGKVRELASERSGPGLAPSTGGVQLGLCGLVFLAVGVAVLAWGAANYFSTTDEMQAATERFALTRTRLSTLLTFVSVGGPTTFMGLVLMGISSLHAEVAKWARWQGR